MTPGQRLEFVVESRPGDLIRARVDQIGIDVSVRLECADGAHGAEADVTRLAFDAEQITAEAAHDGSYRLVVVAARDAARAGHVRVRVEPSRPATDGDRSAIAAERALQALLATPEVENPRSPESRLASIDALDTVAAGAAAAGEPWTRARALLVRTMLAVEGRLEEGVEPAATESVTLWRQLANAPALAAALNLEAVGLLNIGRYADAEAPLTEAASLSRTTGDLAVASLAMNNLGTVRDTLGDAEAAYVAFREALALRTTAGQGIDEAAVLLNLARLASSLGNLDEARELHERVRPLVAGPDHLARARIWTNNYGNLLRRMGDLAGAQRLHEASLDASRRLQNPAGEAQALNGLGTDLFEMGRLAEAEDYQRRSVTMRRALNDPFGLSAGLQSLARTTSALGRHGEALDLLRESLAIRERVADVRALPGVWHAISEVEQRRDRLDEALAAAQRSMTLVESLRDALTAPSLRASFVAREHVNYEHAIDVLMTALERRGDAAAERLAFEVADRARARNLVDALLASRVDVRTGVSPALLDEERRLEQAVASASARVSALLARRAQDSQVTTARDTLARASSELERHQAQLVRDSPGYASLIRPEPTPIHVVQNELLDPDTVLLQFAVGDTRSFAWAVTTGSLRSVVLPGRAELTTTVRTLRGLYEARTPRPGESPRDAARRVADADRALPGIETALAGQLLSAFAEELTGVWRGRRLAIVPSDVLDYVPFAALPVPGTTARLLDGHEVVVLPSISALRAVRQLRPTRPIARPVVAIVADPVFEPSDPRLATGPRDTSTAGRPSEPATPAPAAILSRGGVVPLGPLSRLAFSRLEATAIAGLLPAGRVRLALGFAANREAATGTGVASADIVHFATHGLVSPDRPAASGLVMSLLDRRGRPQNGFLRLDEIYNLQLAADLVVLSACQTALGAEVRGEGLVGLTRGFLYAGARRVVASLWAVDDSATAALMTRFYQGLLRRGLSPGAALRAAQRDIARQPQWRAPFFWAGFVVQGDWR